jgi:hypothetical protein
MRMRSIALLAAAVMVIAAAGIGNAFATSYTYNGGDGLLSTLYYGPNNVDTNKTVSGYTNPYYGDTLTWKNSYYNMQSPAVSAYTSVSTISGGALSYSASSYTVNPYSSQVNKYSPGTVNTHSGEYLILAHHFYANIQGGGTSSDDDGMQFNVQG